MALRRPIGRCIQRSFALSLLVVFGNVVAWTYRQLFSGLDERSYRTNRRKFIAEIERSFSYLFAQHGGRLHPSEGENLPRAFDYASVTVEFNEMRVQLTRGRGELSARLAPLSDPGEWRELQFYWQLLNLCEGNDSLRPETSLEQIAWKLQANWDQLVAVFAEENWFPALTNPEWRRFLKLSHDEKLSVRSSMAPKQRKPSRMDHTMCGS